MRPGRRLITAVLTGLIATGLSGLAAAAAGCGTGGGDAGGAQTEAAATLQLARRGFARAAGALLAGDKAGFDRWLAVDGDSGATHATRESLDTVFATLAPLPWRSLSFEVTPLDAEAGLYRVRGVGRLGSAGPPDRLAVVRYLELQGAADGVVIVADKTPESLRRRYLMALHDPVVLQRQGLVTLGDRRTRDRAAIVAAAAARARPRLARVGVATRRTVLITVFSSAEDVKDALGVEASAARLTFFAYPALRVADQAWPVNDVGVMGPWLRDAGASVTSVLTHELAHAYTVRWFAGGHAPGLLVEGIAQAAEGTPAVHLREEVATGDQLWPLPESFATEDVWEGGDAKAVRLGYEVGGSLVEYVLSRWGARRLRPFAQAIAGAESTESGMDAALGEALGVSWRQFYEGWRRYVLAGT